MSAANWEELSPTLHVFKAKGYEGGFERSGVRVFLFLRRVDDQENLLTWPYAEGSALDEAEWRAGIPKWKARVEDAYRGEAGPPPLTG